MDSYIIISVGTPAGRDQVIKRIYTNLTKEPQTDFIVQQDQVNSIKIFHKVSPGVRVLIRTYVVVIIPVLVDLSILDSFYGKLTFELDETIDQLSRLVGKLQSLKGQRIIKGQKNGETSRQLAEALCGLNAKY